MAAFFIATTRVKNPDKFQQYAIKAAATFAAFGGELVIRGKMHEVLSGDGDHHSAAVVSFPDMDSLSRWYHSPQYQELIELRNTAGDMNLVTYQIPA